MALTRKSPAYNAEFEAKNRADAAEIKALKKQNAELKGVKTKGKTKKVNDAIAYQVKKVARKPFWRVTKFIQNEKELNKAGKCIALECDGFK